MGVKPDAGKRRPTLARASAGKHRDAGEELDAERVSMGHSSALSSHSGHHACLSRRSPGEDGQRDEPESSCFFEI